MENRKHLYTVLAVCVLAGVFYGFYMLRMDSTMPPAPHENEMTAQPALTTQETDAAHEEHADEAHAQDVERDADGSVRSIIEMEPHLHDMGVPAAEMLKIRAAAEGGDAHAQGQLGEMYHEGSGVQRDLRKAFYWFRHGAEGGDGQSMIYLGRYYNGEFPELGIRDLDMAEQWLQKQAVAGEQYAMTLLGQVLYAKVREGEKDRQREASWWYNRGTGGGVDESYTPPSLLEAQGEKAATVE